MLIFHCCWDGESYEHLKLHSEPVDMKDLSSWKCVLVCAATWLLLPRAVKSGAKHGVGLRLIYLFICLFVFVYVSQRNA